MIDQTLAVHIIGFSLTAAICSITLAVSLKLVYKYLRILEQKLDTKVTLAGELGSALSELLPVITYHNKLASDYVAADVLGTIQKLSVEVATLKESQQQRSV